MSVRSFAKRVLDALTPARKFHPKWNAIDFEPLTGTKVYFDPSGAWQRKMLSGTYDTFLFDRIRSLKPEGKVIYDIGAHIGFHSLYFSKLVGPTGTVATFEPNHFNFERLQMNLTENHLPNVTAFEIAASDTAGTMKFTTNNNIENGRSTGGFIDTADPHWSRETFKAKGFVDTVVETLPIDQIPSRLKIPAPDIMKIDVEGAEYFVLQGARQILASKKPIVFVEVHSIAAMHDVTTFFESVSYSATIINKESNGVCYLEARPKN